MQLVAPVVGLGHLRTRQPPRAAAHQGLARRRKTEPAQLLGGGLHEPSPDRHQADRILQAEHPSQVGGENLPGAIAHQQIGLNPPALPQLAEAVAQGKRMWLARRSLAGAGWVEQAGGPLKGPTKHGVAEQLRGHTGANGQGLLAAHQPGQLSGPARGQAHLQARATRRAIGHQGLELGHQLGLVCRQTDRPLPKGGAALIQRSRQIGQLQAWLGLDLLEQLACHGRQSRGAAGRQRHQLQRQRSPLAPRGQPPRGIG